MLRAWNLSFQWLDSVRSIYEIALCFSENNKLPSSTSDGALLAHCSFIKNTRLLVHLRLLLTFSHAISLFFTSAVRSNTLCLVGYQLHNNNNAIRTNNTYAHFHLYINEQLWNIELLVVVFIVIIHWKFSKKTCFYYIFENEIILNNYFLLKEKRDYDDSISNNK